MEALALASFEALPPEFRERCGRLLIRVEEFADEETLAKIGEEDAFALTGLYEGVPLTEKSVEDIAPQPDVVRLFRRPILDEWADRGNVALGPLIAHVLVHEIGHHFGLSDDDIAAIDRWWE